MKPPYGLKRLCRTDDDNSRLLQYMDKEHFDKTHKWNIKPTQEYWNELFRVSQYQIIWGGNNFTLPETEYFIVWDKLQTVDNFASAEYAWTNIPKPAKVFRYSIAQQEVHIRKKNGGKRHPTEKPKKLYEFLVREYVKPNWKVLDTHVGSGNSLLVYQENGLDFIGFEIDPMYFAKAQEMLNSSKAQTSLFRPQESEYIQESLM